MTDGKKWLIAVDFDGTIVEHQFPRIGKPLDGAVETLKALVEAGHELILNTCREDYDDATYLTDAVNWCKEQGIQFVSVNENQPHQRVTPKAQQRKVLADVYIDDRNIGGFPGWFVVSKLLKIAHAVPWDNVEQ